jgi:hypothetical protein
VICITGVTARDTYYTVAPDGCTRLHVEVHTGEREHAVARAVRLVGQGPAAQVAAANAAWHLRKGRRVTVYGAGLDLLHGHLVVVGCDRVTPDDAIARHHLEQGATA